MGGGWNGSADDQKLLKGPKVSLNLHFFVIFTQFGLQTSNEYRISLKILRFLKKILLFLLESLHLFSFRSVFSFRDKKWALHFHSFFLTSNPNSPTSPIFPCSTKTFQQTSSSSSFPRHLHSSIQTQLIYVEFSSAPIDRVFR